MRSSAREASDKTAGSRTIFLSVASGHNVADLLRSDVWRTLLAARDLRIVVLSPFSADPRFVAEFSHPRVAFELLSVHRPGRLERVIESILSERFLLDTGLRAVRLQRDRARLLGPYPGRPLLATAKGVVSRLPVSRRTWFRLAQAATDSRRVETWFEQYRPDLVVTSTAGFFHAEAPVVYAARRRRVPVMAVDLVWDNLSSKYRTIRPVDFLTAWNQDMREEAVRYHGLLPERVPVCGAVQFDWYFANGGLPARPAFLVGIGADPARRLVTLATAPLTVYPSTERIVERLARAVEGAELGAPAQLLVRVHPRDEVARYERWRRPPLVLVEKPVARIAAAAGTPVFDAFAPTEANRRHLAATLAHSDVLVNFASTTTIEACIFDTPVVSVGFDDVPGLPLPLSVRRYYTFEHYRPVVELGAVRIAASLDDLVGEVRRYLADPTRDRAARRALVDRLCAFTDGRSGVRVGEAILRVLDEVTERRSGGRRIAGDGGR